MRLSVYVEGGGKGKALRSECREGFAKFFSKAGVKGRLPKVFPCGSRENTFADFRHAIARPDKNKFYLLLIDSEGRVPTGQHPWLYLKQQDGWERPDGATDDAAHLMVQFMETWFLADKKNLAAYFGPEFNDKALPNNPKIEEIPKKDVLTGLESATRQCKPKGMYKKGRHAFKILSGTDPHKVQKASPHAKNLIELLLSKANRP